MESNKTENIVKKIGNVILDYTYYKGKDLYSDGEIEDYLLDIVKNGNQQEILYRENQWPILYHLSDIRENLLEWYPFNKNADVLEIGSGCGALTGLLSRKSRLLTCIELSEKRSLINAFRNRNCENIEIIVGNFQDIKITKKYDYITLIGVWEYAGIYVNDKQPYLKILEIVKKYLKENGKIIIAIENKMGIKYWNGAPEDHTGKLYSGINDYIENEKIRTFSKPEIEDLLRKAKLMEYVFYYPMPDYKLPEVIYSDELLPTPGSERNFGKDYSTCRLYNYYDAVVMDQICSDYMFSYFANSFLIITGNRDTRNIYIKYNKKREKRFQIKTEIKKKGDSLFIRKTALNEQAKIHILNLANNQKTWREYLPKIQYIEGYIEENSYITPYVEGNDLDVLFYRYRNDEELFVEKFNYYVDCYLTPSRDGLRPFEVSENYISVFGEVCPSNKKCLEYTNIDLIFSNLRETPEGKLYCFDYEWVFNFPIPYEYVIWRSAMLLYEKYMVYLKNKISKTDFLVKIGIFQEDFDVYEKMEKNFQKYVNSKGVYLNNYKKSCIMQDIRFM